MSIANILQAIHAQATGVAGQAISILNDGTFGNTLNLGQILKGKVLRHYEGSKYLVEMSGSERIVDSAIPLNRDEVIHGRVVGLDDKVHLKLLSKFDANNQVPNDISNTSPKFAAGSNESILAGLQSQLNVSLNQAETRLLLAQMKTSSNAELTGLSGVIMKKLGVKLNPEALLAISRVLKDDMRVVDEAARIVMPNGLKKSADLIRLVDEISRHIKSGIEKEAHAEVYHVDDEEISAFVSPRKEDNKNDQQNREQQNQWLLGKYLLNSQQDGSVAHKYTTIPLWIGDKYIEFDIALFSQKESMKNSVRHQHLAFNLVLERLGEIEMHAIVSNKQLSLNITTGKEASAEILSDRLADLRKTLSDFGWGLDAIRYQSKSNDGMNQALKTVVEYQVNQDSVNQLY